MKQYEKNEYVLTDKEYFFLKRKLCEQFRAHVEANLEQEIANACEEANLRHWLSLHGPEFDKHDSTMINVNYGMGFNMGLLRMLLATVRKRGLRSLARAAKKPKKRASKASTKGAKLGPIAKMVEKNLSPDA